MPEPPDYALGTGLAAPSLDMLSVAGLAPLVLGNVRVLLPLPAGLGTWGITLVANALLNPLFILPRWRSLGSPSMNIDDIRHVLVVGTGTMG